MGALRLELKGLANQRDRTPDEFTQIDDGTRNLKARYLL